ncbi:MAG TPA: PAS domain-containing protein [Pyrinomonadaceae bacterium]|nr:PAS domain-containing protein [Pyrinomonadaceae bacterium]
MEAQLQAALNLIPAFAWYCNASGGLSFLNERGSDYLGLPKDHPIRLGIDNGAEWDSHISLLHPDDREEARRVWSTLLRTGCAGDVSFRVRNAEGGYRWHLSRAEPVRASDGTLLYWVGVNLDIEDRKQAEFYLAEGQRLARSGSWAFNAAGFDYWSPELFRIYGLDPNRKAPTVEEYIELIHPDDREFVADTIQKMFAEHRGFDFTKRIVRPDGEIRRVRCVGHPATHAGADHEFIGTGIDVTENELLTQELGRSEAYLAEAQRLSHTGSFGWDVSSGEIYWSEETFRIFELDPKTEITIDLIVERTHPDDRQAVRQVIERASSEGTAFALEHRLLMPGGSIKYVRVVGHRSTDEARPSEFVGAVTDITEQRQAEESLRKSEAYLAEAQRLSQTGSWAWNPDKDITYWSEECYRVLCFDPRDGLPRSEAFFGAIHPDDRPRFTELTERAIREKEGFEAEYRIVPTGGAVRDICVVSHPVLSPCGDLLEFTGTVIDITERKRAEQELRRSEAYLADAQKLSHTGSWAWSLTDGIRYWSDECYRVLGFDPQDGLPRFEEFFQRIHPDDQVRNWEVTRTAISERVDVEVEYRIVHPGGAVRHIHSTCHPVLGPSGDLIELTGTVIDITERRRAEEKLRASESKYRHLVDTTPAFVHTALPNGELDFFNCGWLEYVGVPMTDLLGWGWTSAIHPEDVEGLVAAWRESLESGEPLVAESRVRRADGHYCWFLHRKEPLRNEAGEIVKWYGSSIEIEERKIAEEKIHEQEAELRQILDLAPQHISVFAPSGEPLYLNQAGLEYFVGNVQLALSHSTTTVWRADPGEPDATNPWPGSRLDLVHPEDREHFVNQRKKGFLEGRHFEQEARLLRHDGQFRWFLIRFAPIRDERGDITRWCGIGTDIEDRKRAEEEIRNENIALREEIIKTSMFEEIVGNSDALVRVLDLVRKVAPTDSTVLITGETGTGKELIARAIHKASKRTDRAFVSVNCAAIPQSLIASELFGHEKGAFTGATGRRLGRFELAEGGTIFLDEVGELPPETQVALLRVLQEHEFERVGGNRSIKTNVRVIVATNRELPDAIAAGRFREDLFYRLNVFPIEVPPLRKRKEDIPLLVQYFIDRYAREAGKNIRKISKETLDLFQSYPWPGNIRELRNVIERSVIVCETESFSVDESWLSRQPLRTESSTQLELRQRVASEEREAIEAALMESRGRVFGPSGAAARLGIARSTLESKIKTLKIDKNRFRISNPS